MTNPAGAIHFSRLPRGLGGNQLTSEVGKCGHTSSFPKFVVISSVIATSSELYVRGQFYHRNRRIFSGAPELFQNCLVQVTR